MKSVIVTGVSQGIGRAIYEVLIKSQYDVIGIDKQDAPFCQKFIKGDLSDHQFVENISLLITEPIVGIVNNAALFLEKNIKDTSYQEWEEIFKVNVHAPFLLSKNFIKHMHAGGSIINISSIHAKATQSGLCAYTTTKGALSAMTRAMAVELGSHKIRVNAILPGAIETPMLYQSLAHETDLELAVNKLKFNAPLHKIGIATDIAAMVAFLMNSDLSGNITGQEFVCDSGVLAKIA